MRQQELSRRLRRSLSYQRLIPGLALVSGLPAISVSMALLWTGEFAIRTQWTLSILVVLVWVVVVRR